MKISPCFTHPQGILGVYDLFQMNPIGVIFKIVLALSSSIMTWAGGSVQQVKSSQIKRTHPY